MIYLKKEAAPREKCMLQRLKTFDQIYAEILQEKYIT